MAGVLVRLFIGLQEYTIASKQLIILL